MRLTNRACLFVLAAAMLSGCEEDRLLIHGSAENEMWKFGEITDEMEDNVKRIEFSHPRHGDGIAYVKTIVPTDPALPYFYGWAQCFERGAALDLELREKGWGIEDRWMVEDYCAVQMERVEVHWVGVHKR